MNRTTDDLISRASFRSNIQTILNDTTCPIHIAAEIEQYLELEPAVDAAPVVHGLWIYFNCAGNRLYQCSECYHWIDAKTDRNYCPNCGAKMEIENE